MSNKFLRAWYAYRGNWKEYSKIYLNRKSLLIPIEQGCIIQGCYFHLEFAKWCKNNFVESTENINAAISLNLL